MAIPTSPAELTQCDRFLQRAVRQRCVYAVAGEDGLARVPSRRFRGREVALFWTLQEEAERWAAVVATHPRLKRMLLAEFVAEVLPALATLRRFAGLDWSASTLEIEADPLDLAERIRLEALEGFVERATTQGRVYILEDGGGPALLVSATRADQLFLPCWSSRDVAQGRIEGPWRDMLATEIPIENFLRGTLGWLEERGWMVGPEHLEGAVSLELDPAEVRGRLLSRRQG